MIGSFMPSQTRATTNMNMIMGIMIMRENITRTILTAMTGNIITIITPPLRISKR